VDNYQTLCIILGVSKHLGYGGYGVIGARWFVYFLKYEEARYAPMKANIATRMFSMCFSY
jgi:hypothetical protein